MGFRFLFHLSRGTQGGNGPVYQFTNFKCKTKSIGQQWSFGVGSYDCLVPRSDSYSYQEAQKENMDLFFFTNVLTQNVCSCDWNSTIERGAPMNLHLNDLLQSTFFVY